MQKEVNSNKTVYFEWEAPVRYYEQKTQTYFRAIISLGALLTLALYFLGEYLLILVVWSVVFVYYVKAAIPPLKALYKLTKFGIQYYEQTIAYEVMQSFTIAYKPKGTLLRVFISGQNPYEIHVLLPENEDKDRIISFLQDKIPFIERVPQTEAEKFIGWLSSIAGLS